MPEPGGPGLASAEFDEQFPRLAASCRNVADQGAFATLVDVSVIVENRASHATFGHDEGVGAGATEPVFELHCLAKPIMAWTLLEVAARHRIDPHAPLGPLLGVPVAFDEAVTVAGICNHTTRLALPSALDWVATAPADRPGLEDLRQEPGGAWYSEVGAWIVADAVIARAEGRPTTEVVADLVHRCRADASIGAPVPAHRHLAVPIAGLPELPIPMLHVLHPTFQARLGPAFGGFGTTSGYVRFLREVGRTVRAEPSALSVSGDVLAAVRSPRLVVDDSTWRRPAGFRYGFVDAATPGEPGHDGCLVMFAGIASGACLVDLHTDRQIVIATNGASFDATDHRVVRRTLIGAFLDDTAPRVGS